MKKLVVILIAMVYGLSSTGAIVNLDYCCGKIANISLLPVENDDCKDKCITPKSCCDSKQIYLKVKGEQEVAAKWIGVQKQTVASIALTPSVYYVVTSLKPVIIFPTGPPLLVATVPIYLQHCHITV